MRRLPQSPVILLLHCSNAIQYATNAQRRFGAMDSLEVADIFDLPDRNHAVSMNSIAPITDILNMAFFYT